MISLVVAVSRNGIIGDGGKLPWRLPSDLKNFKATTLGKPVIMGRKTWDSLPRKPLPGRKNVVLTRRRDFAAEGAEIAHSVEEALALAGAAEEICVIGGGEIYAAFMPIADRLHLTEVDAVVTGTTRFPALRNGDWVERERIFFPAGPDDTASFTVKVLDRAR